MKTVKARTTLTLVMALAMTCAWAQGPNDTGTYYQSASGKSGAELKTALWNIIKNPSVTTYKGLFEAYKKTDTRPDGFVRDWYSNTTNYRHNEDTGEYKKEGDSYNREHSVPQSWFGEASPMKSDVVHVFPTDGYVNNRRSNFPFGEVGSATYQSNNGYSKLGSCKTAGYSGTVFEPNDEIKGDIARIYFYMATCYEDKISQWGGESFGNNKYPGLAQWTLDMMMRWSRLDPVDQLETDRNNAVQEVQGNRNPFVDYPGLEDYVWGQKKEQPFSYDQYDGTQLPDVATVSMPVFSPGSGTYVDQVEVSISTATDGATVYYTTDGTDASEQSSKYEAPITLTSTTTLKAIAVKDGMKSSQTTATYQIVSGSGGGEEPVEGMIALNSQFFNCSYNGSIASSITEDLVGTQNGVTVVYSLGEGGANRYCSANQIRLYQKNTLTVSVASGVLAALEFELTTTTSKKLQASTGTVNGLKWTGNAQSVVFSVNEGSGNMPLMSVKVSLAGASGIQQVAVPQQQAGTFYTLSGQRVGKPGHPGVYIRNGKKVIVR